MWKYWLQNTLLIWQLIQENRWLPQVLPHDTDEAKQKTLQIIRKILLHWVAAAYCHFFFWQSKRVCGELWSCLQFFSSEQPRGFPTFISCFLVTWQPGPDEGHSREYWKMHHKFQCVKSKELKNIWAQEPWLEFENSLDKYTLK